MRINGSPVHMYIPMCALKYSSKMEIFRKQTTTSTYKYIYVLTSTIYAYMLKTPFGINIYVLMIMSMVQTNNRITAILFYHPTKSQYLFGQLYARAHICFCIAYA